MVVFNIVVFLISLSLVIMIHELGHFWAARRAGILCHEFSLGMGPVLWSTKKGETVYSIRAVPIGGFVMMAGEEVESEIVKIGMQVRLVFEGNVVSKIILDHDDEKHDEFEKVTVEKIDLRGIDMTPLYLNEYEVKRDAFYVLKKREIQIAPHDRGFDGKTKWERFLAIFAGPAMNFVLAFFVFLLVNFMVGFPNMDDSVIGTVGEGYPAWGIIESGDEVTRVEGVSIDSWDDLSGLLDSQPGNRDLDLTIIRDGVTMDVVLTPVIYFYSIGFHSSFDAVEDLTIGAVSDETLAGKAGFEEGDQIVSIDGVLMTDWDSVIDAIAAVGALDYLEGREVVFEVMRDGEVETITVVEPFSTAFLNSQNIDIVETKIGISPEYNGNFFKSIGSSFANVGDSAKMIFTTIGLLFDSTGAGAGIGVDNLAGPLGIYEITSAALSNGFISLLGWVGLLSVNLGIINLLPIPALDGGRLVFLGYEAISNRKPNKKVENTLHYVMYLALMGLFVFITFNDLLRILNIK